MRAVYHGRLIPRLLGKTAIVRLPDPVRGEPCAPHILMARFEDLRIVYGIEWWPFFREELTLYPVAAGTVADSGLRNCTPQDVGLTDENPPVCAATFGKNDRRP